MSEEAAKRLIKFYRDDAAAFLKEEGSSDLSGVEQAIEVLEAALRQPARLSVGFVGESQVGKSSLVNALLGRTALPAGGIGPLTASATKVRYAKDPWMAVKFHGKKELHQVAFAIEMHLVRRGRAIAAAERTAPPPDGGEDVVPPDPSEIQGDDQGAVEARAEATRKMTSIIAQAKQLLTLEKGQSGDLTDEVALEGLRAVLGHKVRCAPEALAPLADRIQSIKRRLGTSEMLHQSELGSPKEFDRELRLRAAGWLSPLVAGLDVRLNADLLQHLDLTDLPGVGVVGDPAAALAQAFVTNEGGSLILVMRNNGMTDEIARLLERTGVIRRLLFGGRDEHPPVNVIVVVTHLDNVAKERHSAAAEAADDGDEVETPDQVFIRLAEEMRQKVRSQIAVALASSPSLQDLPADQRGRRDAVVKKLCDDMVIECVAAPDYAGLTYRKNTASAPFLQTTEGTGIPALLRHLGAMAKSVTGARQSSVESALLGLQESLDGHFKALGCIYQEGGGQAQEAWETFRGHLEKSLHTLRPQMAAFQGEALGVLRGEVPKRIELLCANAEKVALTRLSRLKGYGQTLHYQSLNAALLRNGIWERKGVDYPDALTSAIVDTIATDWEPQIIETLRTVLREVAKRSLGLVELLCEEAQQHDKKIVLEAQIEAQKKVLIQQSQTAVAWTKEKLESLREEVQRDLYDAVLKPIEKACSDAVGRKANHSAGAKQRILEAFQEGGKEAIEKAAEKAKTLLLERYRKLLTELKSGFLKEHHDPVQAAFDALTNETLARARRSDSQKRRKVLARLAELDATFREAIGTPQKASA